MTPRHDIQAFADAIAREFRPERIILFGSHARGEMTADSDVDLLVVMNFEGRPHEQAVDIRARIPRRFPLDLLVRTPQQIAERLRLNDFFIQEILERGAVLYENGNERVG